MEFKSRSTDSRLLKWTPKRATSMSEEFILPIEDGGYESN